MTIQPYEVAEVQGTMQPMRWRCTRLALALGCCLALAACGGKAGAPQAGAPGGSPAAAQPAAPLKVGDTAQAGNIRVTVLSLVPGKSKVAPQGRMSLGVEVKVENGSKQAIPVNSVGLLKLKDPQGETHAPTKQVSLPGEWADGLLEPGKTLQGWVGFDIPVREGEWSLLVLFPGDAGTAEYRITLPKAQ